MNSILSLAVEKVFGNAKEKKDGCDADEAMVFQIGDYRDKEWVDGDDVHLPEGDLGFADVSKEDSSAEHMLKEQVRQLDKYRLGLYLCRPRLHTGAIKDLLRAQEVYVSKSAIHKLFTSTVRDFVWLSEGSGPPPFRGLASLVCFYEAQGVSYTSGGAQMLIPLECVVCSATYSKTSAGVCFVPAAFD